MCVDVSFSDVPTQHHVGISSYEWGFLPWVPFAALRPNLYESNTHREVNRDHEKVWDLL